MNGLKLAPLKYGLLAGFMATAMGCRTAQQSVTKEAAQSNRPNIIFILTDDQRWDSVGYMGQKTGKTPNLDQLASDGVVFDNAYVTSAICTPSRACYLLGQFERRHGINFNSGTSMSDEAWNKSYPVVLRNNGYFTGYIGKNHVPIGDKGYFTGLMDSSFDYWYAGHHHIGFYPKDMHAIFDNSKADTQPEVITEGALAFIDPNSNETFLNNAVNFLAKRPADKPFCLSVCFNLPHGFSVSRMEQRPSDDALYRTGYREYQDTLPLAPHYLAHKDITEPKIPADLLLTQIRQNIYDWVNTPESARDYMIRTMQAVTGIDRVVGKLRDQLKASGMDENTVIIFAADHGLMNGEFGLGGKALCYETCMKTPLVIYDPREKGGQRLTNLVQSIDVAPTILSLAGVPVPDTMQGANMMPLIRGEKVDWRQAAFGENLWSNIFGNPRCETVRTAEYRYIRYFKNGNLEKRKNTPNELLYTVTPDMADDYRVHLTSTIEGEPVMYEELYHTSEDTYEAVNLANDPTYAKILNQMRAQCTELVAEAKGDINTPPATVDVDPKYTKTHYRNQQD